MPLGRESADVAGTSADDREDGHPLLHRKRRDEIMERCGATTFGQLAVV